MRQSNAAALCAINVVLCGCHNGAPVERKLTAAATSAESVPAIPSASASSSGVAPAPAASTVRPGTLPVAASASERSTLSVPSASPLRGGLSVSCYDRFAPGTAPHVDVVRLGVSCGPENGLSLVGRVQGTVDEARTKPAAYQWTADRGDCFRVFAVAAAPVDDLEVEVVVVAPHAERVSLTNQSQRWVVIDEDGPFCAQHAGTYEARFSTHGGHGAFAAAVWKGARMLAAAPNRIKL